MSKKPPIVILPPLTPPLDDELPLDGEPPLPGAPGMAAGLAPVVFAWVPETSPCWTATAEAGWLNDLTVTTPSTAPSTMAAPSRETATRSRKPRDTGTPPLVGIALAAPSPLGNTPEYDRLPELGAVLCGYQPNK